MTRSENTLGQRDAQSSCRKIGGLLLWQQRADANLDEADGKEHLAAPQPRSSPSGRSQGSHVMTVLAHRNPEARNDKTPQNQSTLDHLKPETLDPFAFRPLK